MIEIFNFNLKVWFGLNTLFIEGFMLEGEEKVEIWYWCALSLPAKMRMLVNKIEILYSIECAQVF